MSTYITITLDLKEQMADAVNFHVKHMDGDITWRIDGHHDPFYLQGSPEDMRRFAASILSAVENHASTPSEDAVDPVGEAVTG